MGNIVLKGILTYYNLHSRERINELLLQGYIVLIDRYIHTNLAYSQIRVNYTYKYYLMYFRELEW